jgi:hypothetical protein
MGLYHKLNLPFIETEREQIGWYIIFLWNMVVITLTAHKKYTSPYSFQFVVPLHIDLGFGQVTTCKLHEQSWWMWRLDQSLALGVCTHGKLLLEQSNFDARLSKGSSGVAHVQEHWGHSSMILADLLSACQPQP